MVEEDEVVWNLREHIDGRRMVNGTLWIAHGGRSFKSTGTE